MYPQIVKKQNVYILCHQGLGDHLLCIGIYREYAKRYQSVLIPSTLNYFDTLKVALSDLKNVFVVPFDNPILDSRLPLAMESQALILEHLGFDVLRLGTFGENFFLDLDKRLDENYYDQANLHLNHRWDSFYVARDESKEIELKNLLVADGSKYIFVHDDKSRNFEIREEYFPNGYKVVRPNHALSKCYSFFDYLTLIEQAEEIHCIESSFAALIEGLQIPGIKFAHRYARPEALNDYRHEFTYRTKWEIIH
jgi:hypothetical protein